MQNKDEYIELLSRWYQRTEAEAEINAMIQGVKDVMPPAVLDAMAKVLTPADLSALIAGRESFDVDDWRAHAVFHGFDDGAPQPGWLHQVLAEAEPSFRRRMLKFATGSTNVPMGGFSAINPPFTIQARLAKPEQQHSTRPAHSSFSDWAMRRSTDNNRCGFPPRLGLSSLPTTSRRPRPASTCVSLRPSRRCIPLRLHGASRGRSPSTCT